jgi:adenosine/AMP kinase
MELKLVKIEKPADMNFILGQSHFIKTVEDIYEAVVSTNSHMKFGLAFCESSGPALVRFAGNDEKLVGIAKKERNESFMRTLFSSFHGGRFPHQHPECHQGRP